MNTEPDRDEVMHRLVFGAEEGRLHIEMGRKGPKITFEGKDGWAWTHDEPDQTVPLIEELIPQLTCNGRARSCAREAEKVLARWEKLKAGIKQKPTEAEMQWLARHVKIESTADGNMRISVTSKNPEIVKRAAEILTEDLIEYVKTFRGLEYATDNSIATFLYDDMGFIPALSPEGNKFRIKGVGRGWEFPPLLELRERWETLFGGQWDWHHPEIDEWEKPHSILKRPIGLIR
jgi:hypothetical protein